MRRSREGYGRGGAGAGGVWGGAGRRSPPGRKGKDTSHCSGNVFTWKRDYIPQQQLLLREKGGFFFFFLVLTHESSK